ncbi:50S ribosomal protein L21 [Thermodesulfovibrionales bacterium]|nr:50S ribosomal protein L21 [Thermodesulfovibrionales bacterium]
MYAVVRTNGKQIKVSVGDKVRVEKVDGDIETEITMNEVLMISKDAKVVYGRPYIEGATVKAEIIETGKLPKVLVYGPRPKKALKRLKGHRQKYTTLKIKEIT